MKELNRLFTVSFQFGEMVATVTKVHVNEQALVKYGQVVIELESENVTIEIRSPMNGLVKMKGNIKVGTIVRKDDELFTIDQALVHVN